MKTFVAVCLLLVFGAASLQGQAAKAHKPSNSRTNQQIINFILDLQEKRVVDAAESMPEDKYNFAPTAGEFHGVRTFAEQVRHIACDNWMLGAGIVGEKPPVEFGPGESGNVAARTKPEIIRDLKASFAYMRKAAATSNDGNLPIPTPSISPWPEGEATRLGVAVEDLVHTWDHYGQIVEYLRMNGIVPPASRR